MKTKLIEPDAKTYFKIFLHRQIRLSWWKYVFLWLVTTLIVLQNFDLAFTKFLVIFSILFPLFIVWHLWRYTHSKENKVFYIPRYFEITDDMMIAHLADNTISEIKLQHFIKRYSTKEYSLFFLSKSSFIYIPKNAFDNEISYNDIINKVDGIIMNKSGKP
jgi:hypothetical protein